MYIVVAIHDSMATVQKMNQGKMMSLQYKVPLNKLLVCQKQESKKEKVVVPDLWSDVSPDTDCSSYEGTSSDSESEDDVIHIPDNTQSHSANVLLPDSSVRSRPVRNR